MSFSDQILVLKIYNWWYCSSAPLTCSEPPPPPWCRSAGRPRLRESLTRWFILLGKIGKGAPPLMLLTSFHSISCSDENRKQLWCVSDEWQSNLSEHEAVRLLPSVWWIFWDVASVLLHFTAAVLGFTPFSALQTPSSDFITLPVHSGSKHLIPLKHCEKHSLSPQKPHQLWPLEKNIHPSVWDSGFHTAG